MLEQAVVGRQEIHRDDEAACVQGAGLLVDDDVQLRKQLYRPEPHQPLFAAVTIRSRSTQTAVPSENLIRLCVPRTSSGLSRSGSDLRHHHKTPIGCHGHPGQAHCTSLALAEWLCRTADRIDPARVYRPFRHLPRGSSAPNPASLCSLLQ